MSLSRVAVVKSPLGDSVLLASMRGFEELGRPFRFELDLTTSDPDIDFSSVLGKTMTVELELHDGSTREFTGHCTEFSLAGGSGRNVLYRAVIRPWLMLMDYRKNCRIFQEMTVPDVIKQVFRDAGFSDFEERLVEDYRTWEYLVQYRESDFAFVSRIMEQEGIYYYVKHSGGTHVVVLCDSISAHEPQPGYETIPYYPPEEQRRDRDHVDSWNLTRKIKPAIAAATDFDFKNPGTSLFSTRTEPDEDVGTDYEEFDYPGEYVKSAEGDKEVKVRLESIHAQREVAEGTGDARGLSVGSTFTLDQFPRKDQNKEYLLVRAMHHIQVNADESGGGAGTAAYRCQFAALDSTITYRASRLTPLPIVEGPQTAIVVGHSGEEIYTDEFGRVKVKFHWDRLSKGDEKSSCWVRVSQLWAGSGFGGIHVPRIGQEVIVSFLEGDPDRPIITGRVYNFDNQVPYSLPANMTQSGIKSHSTKGGATSNFNEFRFEDKLGSEQVYMQAEKDLSVLVKAAEDRTVGASRTTGIGIDDTLTVGANRSAMVTANDSEAVGGSQTVNVTGPQTITVTNARVVTSISENIITGPRTLTVGAGQITTIVGARVETMALDTVTVAGAQSISVGSQSVKVGGDHSLNITGGHTVGVGKGGTINVGESLTISAKDQIVLKAGDAMITLNKNGDIIIKGKNINNTGSGKINLKASSDITLKGSKISNN